jgi:hypothetical protein
MSFLQPLFPRERAAAWAIRWQKLCSWAGKGVTIISITGACIMVGLLGGALAVFLHQRFGWFPGADERPMFGVGATVLLTTYLLSCGWCVYLMKRNAKRYEAQVRSGQRLLELRQRLYHEEFSPSDGETPA